MVTEANRTQRSTGGRQGGAGSGASREETPTFGQALRASARGAESFEAGEAMFAPGGGDGDDAPVQRHESDAALTAVLTAALCKVDIADPRAARWREGQRVLASAY